MNSWSFLASFSVLLIHQSSLSSTSPDANGPVFRLSLDTLQLFTNRLIHAQILTTFWSGNFPSSSSNTSEMTSCSIVVNACRSFVVLFSSSTSRVASSTYFGGHFVGSFSHSGPSLQRSFSRTLPPRLPTSAGFCFIGT